MANDFYSRTHDFTAFSKVRGAEVKAEFDAVEAAFDRLPSIADILSGNPFYLVADGTGDALEVENIVPWETYVDKGGFRISVKIPSTNTGTVTISVDGLGPRPVRRNDNEPLAAGDLVENGVYDMIYDDVEAAFKVQSAWQGLIAQGTQAAATATSQAGIATTQAGIATNKANEAANDASTASGAADVATGAASTATSARDLALQYRDDAEGFRDEAEQFRDEAQAFSGFPDMTGKGGLPLVALPGGGTAFTGSLKRYDLDTISTTATVDASQGNLFTVDGTSPRTLTITNLPAGRGLILSIRYTGSAALTVTNTVNWHDGIPPELGLQWTLIVFLWDGSELTGMVGSFA